ncbi:hypothetical protein [Flavobacterium microcysteis]|uniref:Carboxypeptidase-like regulatory domain-containing protein n=1 Tax=Flavobacterium microcysteis TaxID=2596891 RepID=A0A501PYH1_9FLAO|nr:hypothetical protein [Flavobacterium microcysteis]TPD65610.1 hypothetical protein FJA49_15570 [Flavobacterium microcysteis]
MKNNYFFLILILISQVAFSQSKENKKIFGKITAGQASVDDIEVINFSNATQTRTNSKGEFYIYARVSDVLILSGNNLEHKRKTISRDEFNAATVEIVMKPIVTELQEVVVEKGDEYSVVTGAKKYTPAERKLRTASKPVELIQGLGISNDAILNFLSGKTKMLKKSVQVEREIARLEKLDNYFDEIYYTEKLDIPKDYINGFKYYIVGDENFSKALDQNNETELEVFIIKLAEKYKGLLADEKK